MEEVYYNNILLNEENIKKLAMDGKINEDFPYLNDSKIMITAIKAKPELLKTAERGITLALDSELFQSDVSDDIKKNCLYYAIDKFNTFPTSVTYLLDDSDFLLRLATKDISTYIKVLRVKRNDVMHNIFKEHYEDTYRYNPDYEISYALDSPIVFMKDLESGGYYTHMFSLCAYDDNAINYIIEHKKFTSKVYKMYSIPRILIAKLEQDPSFIYKLYGSCITKEVVDWLKKSNFSFDLSKISENYVISPDFLMAILDISMSNISYLHEYSSIDDSLIKYLVDHNYAFKDGDFIGLLEYDDILKSTIVNGNLDYIVTHDIALSKNIVDFIVNYIKENDYDVKTINNKCLINNEEFNKMLNDKYKHRNIFNLSTQYAISNVGRTIDEEFIKCFSFDVAYRIIDQAVLNNYFFDLEGVLKNIPVSKYKEIYDKVCYKCFRNSNKFDFYFFIKFTEYFANNLALAKDLSNRELTDNVVNNLSMAINNNDQINSYEELALYRENYRKKIITSDLDIKDKICYLLINGNMLDADHLLHHVINKLDAIYLQLDYSKESSEYRYLESSINLINCLEQVLLINDEKMLLKILSDIVSKYDMSSSFNKDVFENNIRSLYTKMYGRKKLNPAALEQKGKCEEIDGVKVYHIEGEDFSLFSHRLDFNKDSFSTDEIGSLFTDGMARTEKYANYVCTTYETMYSQCNMERDCISLYEIDDDTDLIAFGNLDIFISHTRRPFYKANSNYLNPIDMTHFSNQWGYTPTEFDLLRKRHDSSIKTPSYLTCSEREKLPSVIRVAKQYNIPVVCFDKQKNMELLRQMYIDYCTNIDKLNYHEIYKFIRLSVMNKTGMDDNTLCNLLNRINQLSEKEQVLLKGKLYQYGYNISKYKDIENIPQK